MFYQRLTELCHERGTNPTNLAAELKLSSGNLSKWKGGSAPRSGTLRKIANRLNVSTDYLLGLTDQKEPAAQVDGGVDPELLELLSRVPAERWDEVKRYLRFQAGAAETP